jgi:protein phosphatase-4 regulatory subunit 3
VKSEEGGHVLLESKLYSEDIYQLQQDTLIVWNDPLSSDDLALSFQEAVGCTEIWEQILQIQSRMNTNCNGSQRSLTSVTMVHVLTHSLAHSDFLVEELEMMALQEDDGLQEIALPAPNVKNIDLVFLQVTKSNRRERIAQAIQREGYLQKLLDLFKACEDPPNLANLHKMFEIFKTLGKIIILLPLELRRYEDLTLPNT